MRTSTILPRPFSRDFPRNLIHTPTPKIRLLRKRQIRRQTPADPLPSPPAKIPSPPTPIPSHAAALPPFSMEKLRLNPEKIRRATRRQQKLRENKYTNYLEKPIGKRRHKFPARCVSFAHNNPCGAKKPKCSTWNIPAPMQKCRVEYAKSAEKIPPSPPLFDIANRKGLGRIKIDVRAEGDKKTRFQKNTFRPSPAITACPPKKNAKFQ